MMRLPLPVTDAVQVVLGPHEELSLRHRYGALTLLFYFIGVRLAFTLETSRGEIATPIVAPSPPAAPRVVLFLARDQGRHDSGRWTNRCPGERRAHRCFSRGVKISDALAVEPGSQAFKST